MLDLTIDIDGYLKSENSENEIDDHDYYISGGSVYYVNIWFFGYAYITSRSIIRR